MSPKSRLLIFYVREDKEVVADSRMFRIRKCLQNKVTLDFRHLQQYPNTEAAMLLSASPSSLCGISMVDKSVRLLEDDTTFNLEKLFKVMESYDIGKDPNTYPNPVLDVCTEDLLGGKGHPEPPRALPAYQAAGVPLIHYVDATMAFKEAGMIVISDLRIENAFCKRRFFEVYYLKPMPVMGFPGARFDTADIADFSPEPVAKPEVPSSTEEIRSYFPETWLWELQTIGPSGETALKRQLPHTITEWVGGAVCVHPKTGLGISDTSSVTTFQPFFIDFQLPYSVVRGESFTLTVTVFNYLSECLPIKLSLEPSDDYVLLSELRYKKVCVCGGESTGTDFTISPEKLGEVNVTIYGYSIEQDDEICGNEITARLSARDAITKALLVEAEGFPKEDVFNYFICPENTNGSFAAEVPLLLPDDVIMDSARAYMSITGDVMGPALKNLNKLVRLPFGCGEQNMVLFVPNIFVMDSLTSSGKITDDIKEECLNNMKIGYQRELMYRHPDGSYSAFGSRDKEGSLWLTAFVLKSFGHARRFINIDENDLGLSRSWILQKQFENGCFAPSGKLLNNELKGGLKNDEHSLTPLTAYVLISLLESEDDSHESATVYNALKCLETESQLDNYALSLFAYATALAKENNKASKYIEELDNRAIQTEYLKYWESSSNSKSVAVEIAGYYMLTRFALEGSSALEKVIAVVRWIAQQRNSNGGFISTQDTVVALQALAKYASHQSKQSLDIALALETDDMAQGFKLDENNKLVTQKVKIPDLPTTVDIEAYGDGCAIAQFSLRYNVEKISNFGKLELDVNPRRRGSNECNLPSLGICMRYAEHGEKTNMAVLSVKLPSGFVADEWSLLLLENDNEVRLMRHEINENEVNLYFEEITNDVKCLEFHMKSEFEVQDIKPSIVRLYDYYQLERQVTKEYSIPSICNTTSLPDSTWLPILDSLVDDDKLLTSEDAETVTNGSNSEETVSWDETTEAMSWTTELLVETTPLYPLDWTLGEFSEQTNDEESIDIFTYTTNDTDSRTLEDAPLLSKFVDVSHDLDFPDSLEGNLPVSVLPPDFDDSMNCPICRNDFPENFTAIYCNSAFALKIIQKEGSSKAMKILHDISFHTDGSKAIKKFGELHYEEKCTCPQLNEKGKVLLIVGSPLNLWNQNGKKHKINLTSSVYVILTPPRNIHSFITEAKESCTDDP